MNTSSQKNIEVGPRTFHGCVSDPISELGDRS